MTIPAYYFIPLRMVKTEGWIVKSSNNMSIVFNRGNAVV